MRPDLQRLVHQVRAPLTVIKNEVQMAQRRQEIGQPLAHLLLQQVARADEMLAALVTEQVKL